MRYPTLAALPAVLPGALLLSLAAATPAWADFNACVQGLKAKAEGAGVSKAVTAAALDGVEPDPKIIDLYEAQPEFKTPIWDYFGFLIDEQRVADGKRMMAEHDSTLRRAEKTYGVDRHVIAAIWGIESDYGKAAGGRFIPHSLTTLVCLGNRRQDFWEGELMAALTLVQRGDLPMEKLHGSWAGAFGQTQFIPSTYQRLAVDFDGDGKRDLVDSVPDALGSTANYLNKAGWRTGQPWMIEVKAPKGYSGPTGRKEKAELSAWAKRGVVRADGAALGGEGVAGLLLPAGPEGPGFLVFKNFDAIYSYNYAESYALAISHLADRLAGYPTLRTPWPTDDPALSRAQRLELQKLLLAQGYDIGEADGAIGPATRAAIAEVEKKQGWPETGRAGQKVYRALGGS